MFDNHGSTHILSFGNTGYFGLVWCRNVFLFLWIGSGIGYFQYYSRKCALRFIKCFHRLLCVLSLTKMACMSWNRLKRVIDTFAQWIIFFYFLGVSYNLFFNFLLILLTSILNLLSSYLLNRMRLYKYSSCAVECSIRQGYGVLHIEQLRNIQRALWEYSKERLGGTQRTLVFRAYMANYFIADKLIVFSFFVRQKTV